MLRSLSVENYALIDRLDMTLGAHLNIVTGETGAGKSILLGALGLLLGTRSEAGVQKDPAKNCVVEGTFSLSENLQPFFTDNDLDFSPSTTIRRVISASGKSRAYVNDLPVSLSTLRELGDRLIDIHSQHENLLLRDDGFRVSILDGMASQSSLLKHYGEVFSHWRSLLKQLSAARTAASSASRDEDWLRHQTEELSSLGLSADEQQLLEAELLELSHSDEIREALSTAVVQLGGNSNSTSGSDEPGIVSRLRTLRSTIEHIGDIHPRAAAFAQRLSSAHLELQDLEREMASEYDRIEGNPQRLAQVSSRLDAIYALQQKHRVASVAELLDLQADFASRLCSIEHGEEHIAHLEAEAAAAESETRKLATQISSARHKAASVVEKSVVEMLRRLGMPAPVFIVELTRAPEPRTDGADQIRFLFTANASMPPRPVEKIASGGEISRVMLALKTLSARSAGQPTVIFDEIDAGVSGRVADAMGDIIAELALHSQVLNITHLPQIAAKQGEHFLVFKQDGSTHIRLLSAAERVTEIAGMLSGSTVTDAALEQAAELLK